MKKQQGAVLIVSLIILLITTFLGVAAMQSTSLEMKMAKNMEERQRVFQGAEAALRRAEKWLEDREFSAAELNTATCADATSCFESTCGGGLCFFGANTGNQAACTKGTETTNIWDKGHLLNVWNTSTKHKTVTDIGTTSFKYVIEFQCFVDSITGEVDDDPGFGDANYRVTVLAENDNGNIFVMLQSTYGMPAF